MISDDMLRAAAARTCESYVSGLLADFDPEYRCKFSSDFEKKIHRLKRRADHIVFYQTMRRIALILLTLIVAGSIWIAVDTNARAAFFGWVGKLANSYFVYHADKWPGYAGSTDGEGAEYRPEWLPEGYFEYAILNPLRMTTVAYMNDAEQILSFSFISHPDEDDLFLDIENIVLRETMVQNCPAVLFISQTEDVASAVSWTNDDETLFVLSGFVSEAELLRMAESVRRIN